MKSKKWIEVVILRKYSFYNNLLKEEIFKSPPCINGWKIFSTDDAKINRATELVENLFRTPQPHSTDTVYIYSFFTSLQLGIADAIITNFYYTKSVMRDDSAEHLFEIGYLNVRNCLPGQLYTEVIYPTELSKDVPLDRQRTLRVFCRYDLTRNTLMVEIKGFFYGKYVLQWTDFHLLSSLLYHSLKKHSKYFRAKQNGDFWQPIYVNIKQNNF